VSPEYKSNTKKTVFWDVVPLRWYKFTEVSQVLAASIINWLDAGHSKDL
jgi:hypothetical protein